MVRLSWLTGLGWRRWHPDLQKGGLVEAIAGILIASFLVLIQRKNLDKHPGGYTIAIDRVAKMSLGGLVLKATAYLLQPSKLLKK